MAAAFTEVASAGQWCELTTPRCGFFVGLESFVKVNVTVKDINDNKPELVVDEVFLCESDAVGTVTKACYD